MLMVSGFSWGIYTIDIYIKKKAKPREAKPILFTIFQINTTIHLQGKEPGESFVPGFVFFRSYLLQEEVLVGLHAHGVLVFAAHLVEEPV